MDKLEQFGFGWLCFSDGQPNSHRAKNWDGIARRFVVSVYTVLSDDSHPEVAYSDQFHFLSTIPSLLAVQLIFTASRFYSYDKSSRNPTLITVAIGSRRCIGKNRNDRWIAGLVSLKVACLWLVGKYYETGKLSSKSLDTVKVLSQQCEFSVSSLSYSLCA